MPVRKSAAPQSRKAANRTDELIAALKEAEPIYGAGDALAEARVHVHELREHAAKLGQTSPAARRVHFEAIKEADRLEAAIRDKVRAAPADEQPPLKDH